MRKYPEIKIGDKFGRWAIIASIGIKGKLRFYRCRCSCDLRTEREVSMKSLNAGLSKGCGCYASSNNSTVEQAIKSIIKNDFSTFDNYCKNKGIKNNLSIGEYSLIVQQNCAYSGIAPYKLMFIATQGFSDFTQSNGKIKHHSLDRINSDGDYELGNVVACDQYINYGKNDREYSETFGWLSKLKIPTKIISTEDVVTLTRKQIMADYPLTFLSSKNHKINYIISRITYFRNHKKQDNKEILLSNKQLIQLMISPCIMCGREVKQDLLQNDFHKNKLDLIFMLNEIDRWDNSIKSYTLDNSTTLCRMCNSFKNNLSIDDLNIKIINIKQNIHNLLLIKEEFLDFHSSNNTITRLIELIQNGQIIDYFGEILELKRKLQKKS